MRWQSPLRVLSQNSSFRERCAYCAQIVRFKDDSRKQVGTECAAVGTEDGAIVSEIDSTLRW